MFDLALAIDKLVPGAKYGGSTTKNTQGQYSSLRWEDERKKPTWEELQQAWADIEAAPKEEPVPTLEDRIKKLEEDVQVIKKAGAINENK